MNGPGPTPVTAAAGAAARQLALFDLDGTLTRHDTLLPYVTGFLQRRRQRARLARVLPALLAFAIRRIDRGGLKSALIRGTLGGTSRAQLDAWTAQFVRTLLERGMYSDALDALGAHRRAGDLLVLLSASTDLYVPAIGQALGFSEVICTGVSWHGPQLVGRLTTENRRGAEKARCLESLREAHPGMSITAYGNAASDLAHLRLADRGVLVNGSRRARRA
ncbi:MAG TPA: HAD-IB family phosphatase, partial [Candidatus Dormibacteraeota bacterium]|nr:HAD-IB family phosphatase [Candidatus Dormibacteraeota bacterium]